MTSLKEEEIKKIGQRVFEKYKNKNSDYNPYDFFSDKDIYRCKRYEKLGLVYLGYLPEVYNFNRIKVYEESKTKDPGLYYLPIKILEEIITKETLENLYLST